MAGEKHGVIVDKTTGHIFEQQPLSGNIVDGKDSALKGMETNLKRIAQEKGVAEDSLKIERVDDTDWKAMELEKIIQPEIDKRNAERTAEKTKAQERIEIAKADIRAETGMSDRAIESILKLAQDALTVK